MKSKIQYLGKRDKEIHIAFIWDDKIISIIEKAFSKLKPGFVLSDYKKKYAGKVVENFWQLYKQNEDFNFVLIAKIAQFNKTKNRKF